jgi:hypothetical protein
MHFLWPHAPKGCAGGSALICEILGRRTRYSHREPHISGPVHGACFYLRLERPRASEPAGESCLPPNALYCCTTCIASSRVGTSTSVAIPGAFWRRSFSMTGIRNARPVSCQFRSARSQAHPCLRALAGSPHLALASAPKNETPTAFPSYRRKLVILKKSAFCFPAGASNHGARTSFRGEHGNSHCQSCFELRRKRTEETEGGHSQIRA